MPKSLSASSIWRLRRVRGCVIVMTNAALGLPLLVFWRAWMTATMSEADQTSSGLGCAGNKTTSATRTASAVVLVMPGGPSMMTQSWSAAEDRAILTRSAPAALATVRVSGLGLSPATQFWALA